MSDPKLLLVCDPQLTILANGGRMSGTIIMHYDSLLCHCYVIITKPFMPRVVSLPCLILNDK